VSRGITSSLLAGALLMAPAVAQGAVQTPEPGSELRVYLLTMGPGERVWERFGHNAIWIRDPALQPDTAYNYGLFDFQQENFLLRFIRGQMWYWMAGFPAEAHVRTYVRDNRSVWIQELNLPPAARLQLREFLRWNEQPEHRFYHYDYYRDNCSTRVRDALDRVLGGAIKAQTAGLPTGTTYRFHTQRLTANDPPVSTGLLLALGPGVDRPISAWEEMFLPLALQEHARRVVLPGPNGTTVPLIARERTLFESTAPEPPGAPPSWLPWYAAVGAVVGGLAVLLGAAAGDTERRWARVGLGLFSVLWGLLGGLGGVVLAVLWAFTDHAMAYRNENLFQLNPLLIALAVLVPFGLRVHRAGRWARAVALSLLGLSLTGFVLQALPGLDQMNGPIIALLLPIHLGVAAGLWLAIRPGPARGRPPLPGIRGRP
jgi:Domain of unknown function (DUF4105)